MERFGTFKRRSKPLILNSRSICSPKTCVFLQKMLLALPVSIPASCSFDQQAVHDKNSASSFIRAALFVPKHVTLSRKMLLALPVSIPASCFLDQRAVHDKNSTSSFIRAALFVPKHVTLSQKMRLVLPANILLTSLTLSEILPCAHRADMSLDMFEKSKLVRVRKSSIVRT